MSRRKPNPNPEGNPLGILGPDGKPYVPPKKPAGGQSIGDAIKHGAKPAAGGSVVPRTFDFTATYKVQDYILRRYLGLGLEGPPIGRPLGDAFAEQVAALTEGFDGESREELPAPERDLHTYADAFASAAAKCDHRDAIETLYGREWVCDTCHRVLDREAMRRARQGHGWWGMFG